jgi:uncharacterized protein YciI
MTEEANDRPPARNKDVPRNLEPYFVVLLFKGERWNDPTQAEDLGPRQLAFLRRETEAGRCLLAGPITDDGPLVGITILAAGNAAEALTLANQDPGVAAGRLRVEVHPSFLPSLKDLKITYAG